MLAYGIDTKEFPAPRCGLPGRATVPGWRYPTSREFHRPTSRHQRLASAEKATSRIQSVSLRVEPSFIYSLSHRPMCDCCRPWAIHRCLSTAFCAEDRFFPHGFLSSRVATNLKSLMSIRSTLEGVPMRPRRLAMLLPPHSVRTPGPGTLPIRAERSSDPLQISAMTFSRPCHVPRSRTQKPFGEARRLVPTIELRSTLSCPDIRPASRCYGTTPGGKIDFGVFRVCRAQIQSTQTETFRFFRLVTEVSPTTQTVRGQKPCSIRGDGTGVHAFF